MTILSRIQTWVAVNLWYHRQLRRRTPAGQGPATLTRLPRPECTGLTPPPPLVSSSAQLSPAELREQREGQAENGVRVNLLDLVAEPESRDMVLGGPGETGSRLDRWEAPRV